MTSMSVDACPIANVGAAHMTLQKKSSVFALLTIVLNAEIPAAGPGVISCSLIPHAHAMCFALLPAASANMRAGEGPRPVKARAWLEEEGARITLRVERDATVPLRVSMMVVPHVPARRLYWKAVSAARMLTRMEVPRGLDLFSRDSSL